MLEKIVCHLSYFCNYCVKCLSFHSVYQRRFLERAAGIEIVKHLVSEGADVDIRDKDGVSNIHPRNGISTSRWYEV